MNFVGVDHEYSCTTIGIRAIGSRWQWWAQSEVESLMRNIILVFGNALSKISWCFGGVEGRENFQEFVQVDWWDYY